MASAQLQDGSALAEAKSALKAGMTGQAVSCLRQHLAVSPEDAVAHELLGVALGCSKKWEEARAELRRATELAPRHASAHYNLALVMLETGNLDEAVAEQQTVLLLDPANEPARKLAVVLGQRIRDRAHRTGEGANSVGTAPSSVPMSLAWANLPCPNCGAMNFMTARTCARCGRLIPEMPDIRPME